MIRVYHNPRTDFVTAPEEIPFSALVPVADVDTDDLERAFALTNHVDRAWWENPGVSCLAPNSRSTSVGDVMRRGAEWKAVDVCGFRDVRVPGAPA